MNADELVAFSIIIPTRDRKSLLREAVDSVLAQTFHDWEVIIVDDGGEVALDELAKDARIHILKNARPTGPAGARNVALGVARGRYIAFLDDDDAWAPDRLEHAITAHRLAEVVVCGDGRLGQSAPGSPRGIRRHDDLAFILDGTTPHLGRTSVSRDACPSFDEAYMAAEDVDWWFRLVIQAKGLAMYSSPDWLWRKHEGVRHGIGTDARYRAQFQLLDRHHEYLSQHPAALAFRLRRIAQLSRVEGRPLEGLRFSLKSLVRRPSPRGLPEVFRCARSVIVNAAREPLR